MKQILFILCLIIGHAGLFSQTSKYDPQNSIGFIYFAGTENKWSETIHVVREKKIEIFDNSFKKCGYLFFPKCNYASQECWNNTASIGSETLTIKIDDYVSIAYDGYCLKYYEKKGNYIRIIEKTFSKEIWISLDTLRENQLSIMSYKKLLSKFYNKANFYPVYNLNLRSQPDIKSDLVLLMTREKHLINLTGKYRGNWAEVTVLECDFAVSDYLEPKIIKKNKGWCKIFDDKDFPNIWLPTKI
ncbi:MAG TPA: hypothetical protein PKM07_04620 [Spirochaetota bacterium]|nr:hypothetical protein [Spirochaetota bacterium]HOH38322.1 hypothetical protein [Spirochaetota bacterium]